MSPVAISKLAAVGIHTSDDDQARDIVRRLCDEPQRSELLAALDTVPPPARMSRAEYEAIDAINHTRLKRMGHSPAAFDQYASEDSDTLAVGILIHRLVFEPETLDQRYMVWDGGKRDPRCKEWRDFQAEAQRRGLDIMRAQDLEPAEAVAAVVRNHPTVSAYLDRVQQVETVHQWTDAATGLKCKCMVDADDGVDLYDLKTCQDCSPRAVSKAIARYSYHTQAAYYLDGTDRRRFVLIFVEKSPPHKVRCYPLGNESIVRGRDVYRQWLQLVKDHTASGQWPAWHEDEADETEINLPPYAFGDDDDDDDDGLIGG